MFCCRSETPFCNLVSFKLKDMTTVADNGGEGKGKERPILHIPNKELVRDIPEHDYSPE
jgi:hypothetical protein